MTTRLKAHHNEPSRLGETRSHGGVTTMHAVRLHEFGPPENLRDERVPAPHTGPGQVRIKVTVAGVHLLDAALREGLRVGTSAPAAPLPTVPGREVAGMVEALGPGVAAEWLGRRVVAHLGAASGGYAELAVTGVDRLHQIPDSVPEEHALAMVGTGRTTMGILRFTDFSPADTVVVLAAAGGIGALLVQYARHKGAYVIGAAGGTDKVLAVRALGADLAVDYTAPGWVTRVTDTLGEAPASHLLEGVGGRVARGALALLRPGGHHLSYGSASTRFDAAGHVSLSDEESARRKITSRSVARAHTLRRIDGVENRRVLEEAAMALVADGTLTPLVHHFPLADAARAHRALESRVTLGKVVLVPGTR